MQKVRYVITPLALGALVMGGAATASADSVEADFGTQQQVAVGPTVIAYTVGAPQPSTDQVSGPIQGQLYAVETTATAVQGMAVPEIPLFNARSENGQNYRVLFQTAAASGLNPAPLMQGQQTNGKLYFDVTGPAPTEVVYRDDATQNNLVWAS